MSITGLQTTRSDFTIKVQSEMPNDYLIGEIVDSVWRHRPFPKLGREDPVIQEIYAQIVSLICPQKTFDDYADYTKSEFYYATLDAFCGTWRHYRTITLLYVRLFLIEFEKSIVVSDLTDPSIVRSLLKTFDFDSCDILRLNCEHFLRVHYPVLNVEYQKMGMTGMTLDTQDLSYPFKTLKPDCNLVDLGGNDSQMRQYLKDLYTGIPPMTIGLSPANPIYQELVETVFTGRPFEEFAEEIPVRFLDSLPTDPQTEWRYETMNRLLLRIYLVELEKRIRETDLTNPVVVRSLFETTGIREHSRLRLEVYVLVRSYYPTIEQYTMDILRPVEHEV